VEFIMIYDAGTYVIASDGGCSPNPGLGGWAYEVYHRSPEAGCEAKCADGSALSAAGRVEDTTNNIMELTALKMALAAILAEVDAGHLDCKALILHLDSQYALNAVFTWMPNWRRNNWRKSDGKPVKNADLMKELDELKSEFKARGISMDPNWVKGHSGDYANDRVDDMLTKARNGEL
jgi:ribonuclease HI